MNDKMIQPETDSFFDEIANNFTNVSNDYRTIKISIKSSDWVSTITKLKDEHLSLIHISEPTRPY